MRTVLVIALVAALAAAEMNVTGINAPTWLQCDSKWGSNQLGTCSGTTICSAGCAITSVSMYCAARGWGGNPAKMNEYLRKNGGYSGGCNIYWAAPNKPCGISFQAVETPTYSTVCSGISKGHGLVANVNGGRHYVLVTSCAGNNVYNTHDPAHGTKQFSPGSVVRFIVYH